MNPTVNTSGMALNIEQTVQRFHDSIEETSRRFRENPEAAEEFLIRAGIAQKNEMTGKIELVASLQSTETR
ncbi:MAG: hypothetical protein V3V20_06585 [Algisphaera sp.]